MQTTSENDATAPAPALNEDSGLERARGVIMQRINQLSGYRPLAAQDEVELEERADDGAQSRPQEGERPAADLEDGSADADAEEQQQELAPQAAAGAGRQEGEVQLLDLGDPVLQPDGSAEAQDGTAEAGPAAEERAVAVVDGPPPQQQQREGDEEGGSAEDEGGSAGEEDGGLAGEEDGAVSDALTLQLLEAYANDPGTIIRVLTEADPAPDTVAAMVLDLLHSGLLPEELLPQLREAIPADSGSAVSSDGDGGGDGGGPGYRAGSVAVGAEPWDGLELPQLGTRRSGAYSGVPLDTDSNSETSHSAVGRVRQQWGASSRIADGSRVTPTCCGPIVELSRRHPSRVCAALVCLLLLPALLVVLVANSVAFLPPLAYGIDYDAIWRRVGPHVYADAGVYWVGLGHYLIRVPSTIQTIEFGQNDVRVPGRLHARTNDGLPLELAASVQWRYSRDALRDYYLRFPESDSVIVASGDRISAATAGARFRTDSRLVLPGGRFVEVTVTTALLEVVTRHRMHEYFGDKIGISSEMLGHVTSALQPYGILVDSLQLLHVAIPTQLDAALLLSAQTKLQVKQAERYKQVMRVAFDIMQLSATYQRTITVKRANGTAAARLETAEANCAMTEQTVSAELGAYRNLTGGLRVAPEQLLGYSWFDRVVAGYGAQPLGSVILTPDGARVVRK